MKRWRFFDVEGYDSKLKGVNPLLINMADVARGIAGIPFVCSSGLRDVVDNARVGGVPDSAHLNGLAADFRCRDGIEAAKMIHAFMVVGFKRIGLNYKLSPDHKLEFNSIHVDIDASKPYQGMWSKLY